MLKMKVRFIQKLKEPSSEKLSYKIFIIFYNQKLKARVKKWPSYIEKAINHNKQMESKNKEKKADQSKIKSKNLGRPKGQQDKKEKNLYNVKNMKKVFRTSTKSYKLNNN